MNNQILAALQWRYATKKFDSAKKVSNSDLSTLLESIRLSPSSLGLQPWKILLISDVALREKLKMAAYGQSQVTDASHLIVFTTRRNLSLAYFDTYLNEVAKTRNQNVEDLSAYKQMISGFVSRKTESQIVEWNARQVYIALGILLESAALLKIDACPMEGFDVKQFDSLLNLSESEYTTAVIAPIGYRSEDDKYALASKVRFQKKDIIITL